MKNLNLKRYMFGLVVAVALSCGTSCFGIDIFELVENDDNAGIEALFKDKSYDEKKEIINRVFKDSWGKDKVSWRNGQTTLFMACFNGRLGMVEFLLPYCTKETINKGDKHGYTPLYYACCECEYKNLKMVELLLENGADVDDGAMKMAQKNKKQNAKYAKSVDKEKKELYEISNKIYDLLKLAKEFDAAKDKRQFIKDYEKGEIKDEKGKKIEFNVDVSFMLYGRFKNSKEEHEKTLFGAKMPEKYKDAKFDLKK